MQPDTHTRRLPDRTARFIRRWFIALALVGTAAADVRVDLSSRFLVRGEQALLEITTLGDMPDRDPVLPSIAGVEIRPTGMAMRARNLPGRARGFTRQYTVHSYDVGIHRIPPIDVRIGGELHTSRPLDFEVFDADSLHWNETIAGGRPLRYATAIRTLKSTTFEGEAMPVEIKVYVPESLRVEDWGIPEFQVDGIASWRFEPSRLRSQVNLLGRPHIAMAYPATMSATRSGDVTIGPASVRLTTVQVVIDRFARQSYEQITLEIPEKSFESIPLPGGAPAGFANAVGDFEISATTSETDVREGDPVAVDIRVKGSGNLSVIQAPRPVDPAGWRVYDATATERGTERTEIIGEVEFRQFLRPLEIKTAIPAYKLVFFNPATETYQTVTTDPIPLNLLPGIGGVFESTGPPPALGVPIERMTDILAVITPASLTFAPAARISPWLLHGTGMVAALALILRAFWLRFGHLLHRDPRRVARRRALGELQQSLPSDEAGFLRAVGHFIEGWLPGHADDDELRALLAERDAVCFRKEKPAAELDARRRSKVLASLRRAATAMVLAMATVAFALPAIAPAANAAEIPADETVQDIAAAAMEAYESARFDEAARLWLSAGPFEKLSADTLYNIGNASYRLGSPGHAALFFRRALVRDPQHAEARQNLRFIERKFGSVTIHRPDYQYTLGRTPLAMWQNLLAASGWLFVISLLVFPATTRGSSWRVPAIVGLVAAPLLATCAGLAWRYYPNDAEFAPIERQAVVIAAETLLHTEASRTAPEVIEAPQGSLIEILHTRGDWGYAAFATGTRGWIPLEAVEKILPDGPPEPPALQRPRADSRSA